MKEITLLKKNVITAHKNADAKGRKLIEDLIGDKIEPLDIKDQVKTFDDALELVGASDEYKKILLYTGSDKDVISAQAHGKLSIIARALNEGWKPDWKNSDEYKYYPWFELSPSGFAFADAGCGWAGTCTNVGSRLCFKTRELAEYAGKQFENIYNDLLQ